MLIRFLLAALPSILRGLSVTSEIINITGVAIPTCQVQSNHSETETCSSTNEHFGGERREKKLICSSHFLQTNEMSITEMRSQVSASILGMLGNRSGLLKRQVWSCCWCLLVKWCWHFCTPLTVACQSPLPVGFHKQEYWSGSPLLLRRSSRPGDGSCVSCFGRWAVHHCGTREAQVCTYKMLIQR